MEQEIEEKLQEIYKFKIDVKWRDFRIYDIYCKLDKQKEFSVVINYNTMMTLEANINDVILKIDKEICNLYKKEE